MEEHRTIQRRRTLLSAKISFNNSGSTLSCIVRDLSDGGARLQFEIPKDVPAEFDLILTNGNQKFASKVAWRSGNQVGVQFV